MRNLLLLLIAMSLALSFVSCDKDDDDPDYVGTWELTTTMDGMEIKDNLTLTKSEFTSVGSMKIAEEWIESWGVKGTLSASGSNLTLTFTSVGSTDYDEATSTFSDLEWYEPGTEEFNDMMEDMGGNTTVHGEYTVSGSTLTLKNDMNEDGEYSTDEINVYTKV